MIVLAAGRQLIHDAQIIVACRRHRGDQAAAGKHQAGDAHGQFVDGCLAVTVFIGQHLALLGEFDLALYGTARLRQYGFVGGPAAAAHGAATAVEQPALYLVRCGDGDDLFLRLEELPRRGEDAAVLAGIGITQHHFLLIAGGGKQGGVDRIVQQHG